MHAQELATNVPLVDATPMQHSYGKLNSSFMISDLDLRCVACTDHENAAWMQHRCNSPCISPEANMILYMAQFA